MNNELTVIATGVASHPSGISGAGGIESAESFGVPSMLVRGDRDASQQVDTTERLDESTSIETTGPGRGAA